MPSLIESLLGGEVQRTDEKRLTIARRPLPNRPRDFFELFAAMGRNATLDGLTRSMELRGVDPRAVIYAVMGRWPTDAELGRLESPYRPPIHIRNLLISAEFRTPIARRLSECYPERQRLLFVRIPRCAGEHAMSVLNEKHPIMPLDLGSGTYRNIDTLIAALGDLLGRFGSTRTLVTVQPHINPFLAPPTVRVTGPDPTHWEYPFPPCRPIDLLFAIVRPPQELLLSEVNGVLTALRQPDSVAQSPAIAAWREQLQPLPPPGRNAEWKQLGRKILAASTLKNPICTALGEGTDETALKNCIRSPIQLVSIDGYTQWSRSAFDTAPANPINTSTPILQREDLTTEEQAALAARVSEDQIFYDRFAACRDELSLPYVSGFELFKAVSPPLDRKQARLTAPKD